MLVKLMKYDLIRKKNVLIIFISLMFITELFLVFTLYKGDNWLISFFIVSLLVFFGMHIFILYDNIKLLSDDLNQKSGYMMFLTPNHGYNIVGAKMIVGFIELVIAYILVGTMFFINYKYGNKLYYEELAPFIKNIVLEAKMGMELIGFNIGHLILIASSYVLEWFSFITTVYLAIILRKTLLANNKFKGLMSFLIFVVLNVAVGFITQGILLVTSMFGGNFETLVTSSNNLPVDQIMSTVNLAMIVGSIISVIFIVLFYWASAFLLTKKVDL